MTQTMPDKLRLIAEAIEQGKEVQYRDSSCYGFSDFSIKTKPTDGHIYISSDKIYRIKPDFPRSTICGVVSVNNPSASYEAVELTPEVKQALKDAGIEW